MQGITRHLLLSLLDKRSQSCGIKWTTQLANSAGFDRHLLPHKKYKRQHRHAEYQTVTRITRKSIFNPAAFPRLWSSGIFSIQNRHAIQSITQVLNVDQDVKTDSYDFFGHGTAFWTRYTFCQIYSGEDRTQNANNVNNDVIGEARPSIPFWIFF